MTNADVSRGADTFERPTAPCSACFPLRDYDLDSTLGCGQAFRWQRRNGRWEGVVGGRWVRLTADSTALHAQTAAFSPDWDWLTEHLRLDEDLTAIIGSFPDDEPMRNAVAVCRGLRLLRQEPWECLASFILSSTKQIVQIQECVRLLCARFGDPVAAPSEAGAQFAFPSAARIATAGELELRECKLGFRAKYLRGTAQRVTAGDLNLEALRERPTHEAREALMECPGVGRKIADCALLFGYGRQDAFPVDVWVLRALRQLYFPRRRPKPARLRRFTETHFGPNAGYAQQYLFHYMRSQVGRPSFSPTGRS